MEEVICSKLTKKNIYFECPFCYSRYNLNGKPRKGAKRVTHIHGNAGDMENRCEHRGGHCRYENRDFLIKITDKTEKFY